jgi:hypothetical protein
MSDRRDELEGQIRPSNVVSTWMRDNILLVEYATTRKKQHTWVKTRRGLAKLIEMVLTDGPNKSERESVIKFNGEDSGVAGSVVDGEQEYLL